MARVDWAALQINAVPKPCTEPQRVARSVPLLKRGVGDTSNHSWFDFRPRGGEPCGVGARLRGAFAPFFAKSKGPTNCRYNTSMGLGRWRVTAPARREGRKAPKTYWHIGIPTNLLMGNYCEQVVHRRYIQLGLQPMAGQRSPGPPGGRDRRAGHPRSGHMKVG